MTWIKNAMPDDTHWQSFRTSLTAIQEDFKNIEIRPHFSQLRNWFDKRLNDAITAVEEEEKSIAQQVQKGTIFENFYHIFFLNILISIIGD